MKRNLFYIICEYYNVQYRNNFNQFEYILDK
jgi:hypothetical protein